MIADEGADLAITPGDCRSLLRTAGVGRLVFADPELAIRPVNFTLIDDRIVARTDWNVPSTVGVLFEVDAIDESVKQGWSVIVHGHAQSVRVEDLALDVVEQLDPWAPGPKRMVLVITIEALTGRWVRAGHRPDAFDERGYL